MLRSATAPTAVSLFTCAFLFGCGGSQPKPVQVDATYSNLRAVALAYSQATHQLDRGPSNVEELVPFLQAIGDPSQLLRSNRDDEEFVVVWGYDYRAPSAQEFPVFVYEKYGKDGHRFVVKEQRTILELTEAEFAALKFPPGHKRPL